MEKGIKMKTLRPALILHGILAVLEVIALIHDCRVFGLAMFKYYTIDSNVLQLVVSVCILICLLRGKEGPHFLLVLHLICAVCLTVTFMIAAFVLAPQEGFAYYFLSNVAPINHFIGPLFSVITFIFTRTGYPLQRRMVIAPAAATLLYGVVTLIMNAAGVLDGPYFFLRIHETPLPTVVLWFVIIAVLTLVLSAIYMRLRSLRRKKAGEV